VRLNVKLIDLNDNAPTFEGLNSNGQYPAAVTEETKIDEEVFSVVAIDLDGTSPNNVVRYRFPSWCDDCSAFKIDEISGLIRAAQTFNRGVEPSYSLDVEAYDGAPGIIPPEPNTGTMLFSSYRVFICQIYIKTSSPKYKHNHPARIYNSITSSVCFLIIYKTSSSAHSAHDSNLQDKTRSLHFLLNLAYISNLANHNASVSEVVSSVVIVIGSSTNPPEFDTTGETLDVDEAQNINSTVAVIKATDPDPGIVDPPC
jgi:hypothetical protein